MDLHDCIQSHSDTSFSVIPIQNARRLAFTCDTLLPRQSMSSANPPIAPRLLIAAAPSTPCKIIYVKKMPIKKNAEVDALQVIITGRLRSSSGIYPYRISTRASQCLSKQVPAGTCQVGRLYPSLSTSYSYISICLKVTVNYIIYGR